MSSLILVERKKEEILKIFSDFSFTNPRVIGSSSTNIEFLLDVPEKTSGWDIAKVELELEDILGIKVEVMIEDELNMENVSIFKVF